MQCHGGVKFRVITYVTIDICTQPSSSETMLHLARLNVPAVPSGVIVPNLTLTGCLDSVKCCNPCPLPPIPPYCCRPQPKEPQVRQSHRFSLSSHLAQCAKPGYHESQMVVYRGIQQVPDSKIGPIDSCCNVKVCSQTVISSSQAFTSDWRAEDMDCITAVQSLCN